MFKNRIDAANQLLKLLQKYKDRNDVVVVAIPRGSLPMGEVLAQGLHAPLDVVLTKKIGAPHNSELAIGAVSMDSYSLHPSYAHFATPEYMKDEIPKLQEKLKKQHLLYKGDDDDDSNALHNKIVIVVDDGVATGRTFVETMKFIRRQTPQKIIAAIPVIPIDTVPLINKFADKVISIIAPVNFQAVSQFYQEFPQVDDDEAVAILRLNKDNG